MTERVPQYFSYSNSSECLYERSETFRIRYCFGNGCTDCHFTGLITHNIYLFCQNYVSHAMPVGYDYIQYVSIDNAVPTQQTFFTLPILTDSNPDCPISSRLTVSLSSDFEAIDTSGPQPWKLIPKRDSSNKFVDKTYAFQLQTNYVQRSRTYLTSEVFQLVVGCPTGFTGMNMYAP